MLLNEETTVLGLLEHSTFISMIDGFQGEDIIGSCTIIVHFILIDKSASNIICASDKCTQLIDNVILLWNRKILLLLGAPKIRAAPC